MIDIKINGEFKRLKFNMWAVQEYTRISGSDIGSVKETSEEYTQLDQAADVIYCGLFGACKEDGIIIDFTRADATKWISNIPYSDQLLCIKDFMLSMLDVTQDMFKAFEAMKGGDEKKK